MSDSRLFTGKEFVTMIEKDPTRTAHSFTLKGIEGLIRQAERELAELDEFDAQFGEMGREARARGRERALYNLEHARKAYALRKEMGKS
jgi:hypothetical protein